MTRIRRLLRHPSSLSSLALVAASVTNGLAAYAFTVVGIRTYGADPFAPVAVVWSVWAITVAGISSPLQHWIIQAVRGSGSDAPVQRRRVPMLAFAFIGSLILSAALGVWRDSVFGGAAWIYPVTTGGAVATAALTGYVRGILGSRNRFMALSGTLAADGSLRLLLAIAIILAGIDVGGLAVVVPAASLVVVLWTSTFHLRATPVASPSSRSTTSGLGALAGSFLILHLLLNAPPIVASALAADPAVVSSLFAAFALFRAPFLIMSILSTKVSYLLASYAVEGRVDALDRFRRLVGSFTLGGIMLGGVIGGAPAIWALRFVYGAEVTLSTTESRLIASGSVAAVGVLLMVLLLSARAESNTAFVPLLTGSASGGVWLALTPSLSTGVRVASSFLVALVTVLLGLVWADARATTQRRSARGDHSLPSDGTVDP